MNPLRAAGAIDAPRLAIDAPVLYRSMPASARRRTRSCRGSWLSRQARRTPPWVNAELGRCEGRRGRRAHGRARQRWAERPGGRDDVSGLVGRHVDRHVESAPRPAVSHRDRYRPVPRASACRSPSRARNGPVARSGRPDVPPQLPRQRPATSASTTASPRSRRRTDSGVETDPTGSGGTTGSRLPAPAAPPDQHRHESAIVRRSSCLRPSWSLGETCRGRRRPRGVSASFCVAATLLVDGLERRLLAHRRHEVRRDEADHDRDPRRRFAKGAPFGLTSHRREAAARVDAPGAGAFIAWSDGREWRPVETGAAGSGSTNCHGRRRAWSRRFACRALDLLGSEVDLELGIRGIPAGAKHVDRDVLRLRRLRPGRGSLVGRPSPEPRPC